MKDLIKISGSDSTGHFSLQISGEVPGCPDEEAGRIADHYADLILEELRCAAVRARPDFQETMNNQLKEFEGYFRDAGFSDVVVIKTENEYWKGYYGLDKPWADVYTELGTFTIGWRKRVIHLEWSLFVGDKAETLFPNEDVTKYDYVIHCWSPEKCKEYLKTIRNSKNTGGI